MRRLWLRWALLIVFVAVLGVAFVSLGNWQLDRLAQRKERNATTIANEQKPDSAVRTGLHPSDHRRGSVATGRGPRHLRRRPSVRGALPQQWWYRWLRGRDTLAHRKRRRAGGSRIHPARARHPDPIGGAGTAGRRGDGGRTRTPQREGSASRDDAGRQSDALDQLKRHRNDMPYEIKSGYIGLLTVQPEQQGGFQPIRLPDLSEGPHFWYAVQWFMFTAIGVAGIVVFIRGDLRARREEREDATEAHATV